MAMIKSFGDTRAGIVVFLFTILLVACSVSKQISTSAKKTLLEAKAVQTAHLGVSIFEPATGKYWYDYQSDNYFVPASNTKIPTCYAAMKYLGDSLVGIRYNRRGKSILMWPTGDPTFLHPDFPDQPVLNALKNDTAESFIWGTYMFQSSPLGSGWSWNDYDQDYMPERSAFPVHGNVTHIIDTGNSFPKVYINRSMVAGAYSKGYRVERNLAGTAFTAVEADTAFTPVDIPFGTDALYVSRVLQSTFNRSVFTYDPFLQESQPRSLIHSQPTDSMLKIMMHRSDNFFAEQSLMMVSNERFGIMNDEKIIETILKTDFAQLPQPPRWADGSGLSRYNLFSPRDFIFILDKMHNEFGMERIKTIFPTGGEGTISNYYKTDAGYIFAKTGTLSGVVAFSGFLFTRKNKLLIFSILVNNHRSSSTEIRRLTEKFLQSIRNKY